MRNELQFADRVRQTLNQGPQLDGRILTRLRLARETALRRQRIAVSESPLVLAGAAPSTPANQSGQFFAQAWRFALPLLLALAGLFATHAWQQNQLVSDIADIDARLLTDDLPLDAYLDTGFEAWLKKRAALHHNEP